MKISCQNHMKIRCIFKNHKQNNLLLSLKILIIIFFQNSPCYNSAFDKFLNKLICISGCKKRKRKPKPQNKPLPTPPPPSKNQKANLLPPPPPSPPSMGLADSSGTKPLSFIRDLLTITEQNKINYRLDHWPLLNPNDDLRRGGQWPDHHLRSPRKSPRSSRGKLQRWPSAKSPALEG